MNLTSKGSCPLRVVGGADGSIVANTASGNAAAGEGEAADAEEDDVEAAAGAAADS
jgi:hypothetical protein